MSSVEQIINLMDLQQKVVSGEEVIGRCPFPGHKIESLHL